MATLLVFILTLSVLVLAHELGHYVMAKRAGIKVEEFGFGFPPKIWSKKIGETVWSINALPIGGFVRLYGESLDEKVKDQRWAFWGQSKLARTGVIAGGVIANFLLAVVIFAAAYSVLGIPEQTDTVRIVGVSEGSPAAQAGVQEGDVVERLGGEAIDSLEEFTGLAGDLGGEEVSLVINRNGEDMSLAVRPRETPPEGEGPLGVVVSNTEMVFYPWWQRPFRGAVEGFKEAIAWAGLILSGLKTMVSDLVLRGQVPKDVAGPVGILQISGTVAQGGAWAILQFIGILSVNLAIVNFLPFPALDGGRFLFILYELVTKRKPSPEFDRKINTAGMVALLALAAVITVNDLVRVSQTTDLLSRLREAWPF